MVNSIGRLTIKAQKVILLLSEKHSKTSEISSRAVVESVEKTGGMGKNLLDSLKIPSKDIKEPVNLDILVKGAYFEALRLKQPYVGSEHLLLSLLKLNSSALYEEARKKVSKMSVFPQIFRDSTPKESSGLLDLFGTNLNFEVAGDTDQVLVEREALEVLLSTLLQKENPNPLLVGDPGVGKRSLVRFLAKRINDMNVPASLLGYRIYEIDLLSLITNNLNKGDLEATFATFYAELKKLDRVLVNIKNFENLFFATNAGIAIPLIYNSFIAQLDDLDIQVIASISRDVYSRLMEENPRVLSNFRTIYLEEPEEEKTREILNSMAAYLGKHHNVTFPPNIIDYIYLRAQELASDKKFPQKGIELLDRSAAKVLLRKAQVPEEYKTLLEESILLTQGLDKSLEYQEYDEALKIRELISGIEEQMTVKEKKMFGKQYYRVTKADVDTALEDYGEELYEVREQDVESLSTLESRIKERIIGQDEAVGLVSRALLRARLGLRPKHRPLGNFLFLGPTGVGKTELAKVLSDEFFGEDRLIRLDMSDFGEKHTVARLVGAPPGYVGYGEGGELTTKIEKNPSSLVLFDEIEKAHPDVLNILLQITEEGELVDAKGTTFDFSSAVVVLTSNLGTEIVHRPGIGFEPKFLNDDSLEKRLRSNLKKILKPELLNRLDEIVVFKRLKKEHQYSILDLLLEDVRANLEAQDVSIRISHKAKDYLIEKGYSEEYGARALRRTVERELLDKIAEVLLDNTQRPLRLSAVGREDGLRVRIL